MSKSLRTRYALILEYDGSRYAGFQVQKNARTIQGEIEQALTVLFKEPISIYFAGRTDAGVHASGQVVSFDLEETQAGRSQIKARFRKNPFLLGPSLNGLLEKDISVRNVTCVKSDFHPRYSCIARKYEYLIWNHTLRSSLWHGRALWLRQKINLERISRELTSILGLHDFSAFSPQAKIYKDPRRHIYSADLLRKGERESPSPWGLLSFQICANSFLHNMIRILVGTLLEMNAGRIKDSLRDILEQRERKKAGATAPPLGLYFRRAYYPAGLELGIPPQAESRSESRSESQREAYRESCLSLWRGSTIEQQKF